MKIYRLTMMTIYGYAICSIIDVFLGVHTPLDNAPVLCEVFHKFIYVLLGASIFAFCQKPRKDISSTLTTS